MRTGKEYRASLKDGRSVYVLGIGQIDDITTHPATKSMVDAYALWYDRLNDLAWHDRVLTPPDAKGHRRPIAFQVPQCEDDLKRLGRQISATLFPSGGNMTHTPGYGALIALGLLDTLHAMKLSEAEIAIAAAYRDDLARTGRFLTFSAGGAPAGVRFSKREEDRAAIRLVRETDGGIIISGKISMHTSSPFADDVFIAGATRLRETDEHYSWFIIPVNAPGVRLIARKPSARYENPFLSPMTHQFDELDAMMWLDDVFLPWERVFKAESPLGAAQTSGHPLGGGHHRRSNLMAWLFWHQHYCWLAKAEFTLGLALAAADAMGSKESRPIIEQLTDMVIDVQTARSCTIAAECDPELSDGGFLMPGQLHVASASLHTLHARQRLAETARRIPGSSVVVAPSDQDFENEAIAAGLEQSFGGKGYTARQRAALLNLIWDNVSSHLDGRESTYEMHAGGGVTLWRNQMRVLFPSYDELANGVLDAIAMDMPKIDMSSLQNPLPPRRAAQVAVPTPASAVAAVIEKAAAAVEVEPAGAKTP